MAFPMSGDKPVPHLEVNADTGNFVYAVAQLPPGKSYMGRGVLHAAGVNTSGCSAKLQESPASYEEKSIDDFIKDIPDRMLGEELGDMFLYSGEPGYDGGDSSLLSAADIRKVVTMDGTC